MNTDVLITVLSWEDRYFLGLEKNIATYQPATVLLFKYNNPLTEEWKRENLQRTKDLVGEKLKIVEIEDSIPKASWFVLKDTFKDFCKSKKILLDITTMKRETIWLSLFNAKINGCETDYIYHKPQPDGYSPTWLSRDPGKPRLLYKMSGIAKLGAPTLLLVTGGYDIERLDSLIFYYEPKRTMLFFQEGDDPRNKVNMKICQELLKKKYKIELLFEYDAYDVDSSYNRIFEKLSAKENRGKGNSLEEYNVILNSLGAKTSAISLFNIWLKFPQVALSYIPSREYNREYSKGIGESYSGRIPFKAEKIL